MRFQEEGSAKRAMDALLAKEEKFTIMDAETKLRLLEGNTSSSQLITNQCAYILQMTRRKSIGKSFRSRSQKAKRDEECEEDEEDEEDGEEEEECAEVVKTLYKEFSQLSLLFRTEKRRRRVSRIKKEESEGELTKIGGWILEV